MEYFERSRTVVHFARQARAHFRAPFTTTEFISNEAEFDDGGEDEEGRDVDI